MTDTATKFRPPEEPEFFQLMETNKIGRRRKTPQDSTQSQQLPVTVNIFQDGKVSSINSDYNGVHDQIEASKHVNTSISISHSSPIKGFRPRDYNDVGLKTFLEWCRDRYEDDEYMDIFPILSSKKMGIHIFKKTIENKQKIDEILQILMERCMITPGIAQCLIDDFPVWYKKIAEID
jgi:hypothetical protein